MTKALRRHQFGINTQPYSLQALRVVRMFTEIYERGRKWPERAVASGVAWNRTIPNAL